MQSPLWPRTADELIREQVHLATVNAGTWRPDATNLLIAGCYVCFGRGGTGKGSAGDPGWAAAVLLMNGKRIASAVAYGRAAAGYEPGLLALREGALLEAALQSLPEQPHVVVVNATGLDHPRRAGLAVHLGARMALPSVGVTDRLLLSQGDEPADMAGASTPLLVDNQLVGYWLRTRAGVAPIAVHAGWQTGPDVALELIRGLIVAYRTPEPIRQARRLAREARQREGGAPADRAGKVEQGGDSDRLISGRDDTP